MSFLDKLKSLFTGAAHDVGASPSAMIPCEEALSVVDDFLEGELPGVSHEQVKAHFDACQRGYPHLHLEEVALRIHSQDRDPNGIHRVRPRTILPHSLGHDFVVSLAALSPSQEHVAADREQPTLGGRAASILPPGFVGLQEGL